MPSLLGFLLAALAAGFAALAWKGKGAAAERAATRAGYFAEVAHLFANVTIRVQPTGFARLAGTQDGLRYDLQALPDTLTFRKLPCLWVMITLTEPVAVGTELHIMARPTQAETFSHYGQMPVSVALPPGFPEDCALRCLAADALPPRDLIAGLAVWFADPRVKEVVISPKGLRIVLLAEEAERAAYLLFRDAEMGRVPVAATRLLPHLAALAALRQSLATEDGMNG